MLSISYFKNGLLCAGHNHRASCAVDALLKLYFYGIYQNEPAVQYNDDVFITLLNETCRKRSLVRGAVNCTIREPVWDWLVSELANAYAPKGTNEAEIIEGIKTLTSRCSDLFGIKCSAPCICDGCVLAIWIT